MLCQIADLIVEVPKAGGMAPRCRDYLTDSALPVDITINEAAYRMDDPVYPTYEIGCYLESGHQFYGHLLKHAGLLLHASALEFGGKAYLFSGPSGVGKSTHTRLWLQRFGQEVRVFNDDKPALRYLDGRWYAYGTPWCGKDGINENRKASLGGICFLKQAEENAICRLSGQQALASLYSQTMHNFRREADMDRLLSAIDLLVRHVPIWELANTPGQEAVDLAYSAMVLGK